MTKVSDPVIINGIHIKNRLTFAVTGSPAYIIKPQTGEAQTDTVKKLSEIL